MTVSDKAPDDIIPKDKFNSEQRRETLLAMRGYLAHGVMWHCLKHRWRVDYGVMPVDHPLASGKRRKQTAVPFRAADTPADRAEFAHADSTLA